MSVHHKTGNMLIVGFICFAMSLLSPNTGYALDPDYRIWQMLLSDHVNNGGVDYAGFQEDETKLDAFLQTLSKIEISGLSRDEQFAFYVNLYNAWTIKLILSKYPNIKSIKELGNIFKSPWKKDIVIIEGQNVSLDHIEHKILRPHFKDPRIHFVVNCASKSCPPLGVEPYYGSRLEEQLESATGNFLNDGKNVVIKENIIWVSRIFKFYPEDFDEGVMAFVSKYARGGLKTDLDAKRDPLKVKYLDYDWSLNGR